MTSLAPGLPLSDVSGKTTTKQTADGSAREVRVPSARSCAMAHRGGCDRVVGSEVEPVGKSAGLKSGGEMAVKEEERQPTGVRHPAGTYPLCRISKLINWKRPLWTSAFFATTNIVFWWDTWRSVFSLVTLHIFLWHHLLLNAECAGNRHSI